MTAEYDFRQQATADDSRRRTSTAGDDRFPSARLAHWAATLAVLLVNVAVLRWTPTYVFLSPDEGAKLIHAHTMHLDDGSLEYRLPYPGEHFDPLHLYSPLSAGGTFLYPRYGADGEIQFHWPLGFPLLTRVMEEALGRDGIYVLPLLSGVLIAFLSGSLAALWRPWLAPAAVLAVGIGSPVFFYSVSFWEHTLASMPALAATWLLAVHGRGRLQGPTAAATAVVLILSACLLRIEILAFAVAFVVTAAVVKRAGRLWNAPGFRPKAYREGRRRWILAAALIGMLALILTGLLVAGLTPRHAWFLRSAPDLLGTLASRLLWLPRSLGQILIHTPISEGPEIPRAWPSLAVVGICLCAAAAFVRHPHRQAVLLLPGMALLGAFTAALLVWPGSYRSLHGFVPAAPCAVLGLLALPQAWRSQHPARFAIAFLGLSYLLLGIAAIMLYYVRGRGVLVTGLEWGQRYLLTAYPLLLVAALGALCEHARSCSRRRLVTAVTAFGITLLLLGAGIQARGVQMSRLHRQSLAFWDMALRDEGPVVTDIFWLPAALTSLYLTHDMYFARRQQLAEIAEHLAASGVRKLAFATDQPLLEEHTAWARQRGARVVQWTVTSLQITRIVLPSTE